MDLLIGTESGLFRVDSDQVEAVEPLESADVRWLSTHESSVWLIDAGRSIWRCEEGQWAPIAEVDGGLAARCVLATASGVFVGASAAHLLRLDPQTGSADAISGFETLEGRDEWSNPGGSPADTRSLAEAPDGRLYANIHVGGIATSNDGGESWSNTAIEVQSDVHEVIAPSADDVLAATGYLGLCSSHDAGRTWSVERDGLPGAFGRDDVSYCRAIAVVGDMVLITASTGPRTEDAGIYRKPVAGSGPFEKCRRGLPDNFTDNINTGCLSAYRGDAAFGSADGSVFVSSDEGTTWDQVAGGLPRIRAVQLVD